MHQLLTKDWGQNEARLFRRGRKNLPHVKGNPSKGWSAIHVKKKKKKKYHKLWQIKCINKTSLSKRVWGKAHKSNKSFFKCIKGGKPAREFVGPIDDTGIKGSPTHDKAFAEQVNKLFSEKKKLERFPLWNPSLWGTFQRVSPESNELALKL